MKSHLIAMSTSPGGEGRMSVSLEPADNGFVIHTSGMSGGKNAEYKSSTMVAPNRNAAIKIATDQIESCGAKSKRKGKGKGKRVAVKRG